MDIHHVDDKSRWPCRGPAPAPMLSFSCAHADDWMSCRKPAARRPAAAAARRAAARRILNAFLWELARTFYFRVSMAWPDHFDHENTFHFIKKSLTSQMFGCILPANPEPAARFPGILQKADVIFKFNFKKKRV
ncbi:hypothetical protein [Burkholderia plantarii]|uniref:hypothetical protein n=1 Tax=Burkholderia plantarii TaxID=41899 RepID=UPI000F50AF7D|nr:hypothetical protein [Burkholderia plantarii]